MQVSTSEPSFSAFARPQQTAFAPIVLATDERSAPAATAAAQEPQAPPPAAISPITAPAATEVAGEASGPAGITDNGFGGGSGAAGVQADSVTVEGNGGDC